jgi:hypothetical protein
VEIDTDAIEGMGIEVRFDDLVDAHPRDPGDKMIRHNPLAIGTIAEELARLGRKRRESRRAS